VEVGQVSCNKRLLTQLKVDIIMFNKRTFYTGVISVFVLASCGGSDNKKTPVSSSSNSSAPISSVQSSLAQSSIASSNSSSTTAVSSTSSSLVVASSSSVSSSVAASSLSSSSISLSSVSSITSSSASSIGLVTLNGVAAIGAPIANANIIAKCANNAGFTQTVTTNSQGAYSGTIAANALPCALQITYGTPATSLHSYALTAGVVNITPLTDLIIASASALDPSVWFASSNWQLTQNLLTQTTTNFKTSLTNAGYGVPQGTFDPFAVTFAIGDIWDQLLDQLQAAIAASSSLNTYADLIALIKDGNLNSLPPKASSSGGSGTGNAASCFNADFATQGTKSVTTYKTTDGETNAVINFTSTVEVKGNATFDGKAAIESVSQTEVTGATPSSSSTKSYFKVDASAKRTTYYGTIATVTAPIAGTTTVKSLPERIERYDLAANESYSQTYSLESSSVVFGFPITSVTEFTSKTTFKGIETVTVPAGTFEACRMESTDSSTTLGTSVTSTSTNWISTNQGMLLRTEASGDITELVSGTLNGVAIK
jgi:hypothetical protein